MPDSMTDMTPAPGDRSPAPAPIADVAAELERIAALEPAERAAAAEALESRLRAALDDLATA